MRATMMLAAYRATGADPPFGDPRGYHGVGMEGYFWRITQPGSGAVVVVLLAISRDLAGGTWGMAAIAAHPGGFVRSATFAHAVASRRRLRVLAADGSGSQLLEADHERLAVDLGPGACVDVAFEQRTGWPRRAFGGIGPAQSLPGLSQYWHPHLLGARVRGGAQAGDRALDLSGATAYAEKNWGAGGHPPVWWWGQAHGFERGDACVAFAGGRAGFGGVSLLATSVVVALGGEVIRLVRPVVPLRVAVDESGWRLAGRSARYAVDIEGHANGTRPHLLPVPSPDDRRRLDDLSAMHLAGEMRVSVRRRGRLLFDGVSTLAGLERGRGPQRAPLDTPMPSARRTLQKPVRRG
jgi:tocopherol cyclase